MVCVMGAIEAGCSTRVVRSMVLLGEQRTPSATIASDSDFRAPFQR